MFSTQQQRSTETTEGDESPELPSGEISFRRHVDGAESWFWADSRNNGAVPNPVVNPWNEAMDPATSAEKA